MFSKTVGITAIMQTRFVSMMLFLLPIFLRIISIKKDPTMRPETAALEIMVLLRYSSPPQSSFALKIPPTWLLPAMTKPTLAQPRVNTTTRGIR